MAPLSHANRNFLKKIYVIIKYCNVMLMEAEEEEVSLEGRENQTILNWNAAKIVTLSQKLQN